MNEVVKLLAKAKRLIEKPENWCQNWYAKDAKGVDVSVNSAQATSFCAYGAILRINTGPDSLCATRILEEVICHDTIGHFNDVSTHKEVLAAFDRAIARAYPLP